MATKTTTTAPAAATAAVKDADKVSAEVRKLTAEFIRRDKAMGKHLQAFRVERTYAVRVVAALSMRAEYKTGTGKVNMAAIGRQLGGSANTSASARTAYKNAAELVLKSGFDFTTAPTAEEVDAANSPWDGLAKAKADKDAATKAAAAKAETTTDGDMGDGDSDGPTVTATEGDALTIVDVFNALRTANKSLNTLTQGGLTLTADEAKQLRAYVTAMNAQVAKVLAD